MISASSISRLLVSTGLQGWAKDSLVEPLLYGACQAGLSVKGFLVQK